MDWLLGPLTWLGEQLTTAFDSVVGTGQSIVDYLHDQLILPLLAWLNGIWQEGLNSLIDLVNWLLQFLYDLIPADYTQAASSAWGTAYPYMRSTGIIVREAFDIVGAGWFIGPMLLLSVSIVTGCVVIRLIIWIYVKVWGAT